MLRVTLPLEISPAYTCRSQASTMISLQYQRPRITPSFTSCRLGLLSRLHLLRRRQEAPPACHCGRLAAVAAFVVWEGQEAGGVPPREDQIYVVARPGASSSSLALAVGAAENGFGYR